MSIQTICDHNAQLPQSSEREGYGPEKKAFQNHYCFNNCLHDSPTYLWNRAEKAFCVPVDQNVARNFALTSSWALSWSPPKTAAKT